MTIPATETPLPPGAEVVDVSARLPAQGEVRVLDFSWRGRRYVVESSGRRWQDEIGLHLLVQTRPPGSFELVYQAEAGRWFIARRHLAEEQA